MATYTDNFNRADGVLSGDWSTVLNTGCKIISNEVNANASGFCVSALIGESFDNDQYAEIEIPTYVSSDNPGVVVRMDASGNGYAMVTNGAEVLCYEVTTGTRSLIGYASITLVASDVLGLDITGSTLTASQNGSPITWAEGWDGVDTTHTSGVTGVAYDFGNSNGSRLDNFSSDGWNAASTPTIDSMDDPIRLGSTSAHTVSNFSGPITSAIISRDGISVAATSVSDTEATWPALAQNLVTPSCGTGATITLSDGTDSANTTVEFLPDAGYTWDDVGTVSGSLEEGDFGNNLGLESNQDGFVTRDADSGIAIHGNDGVTNWKVTDGTTLVYTWDKNAVVGSDGGWTSNTLTNSSGVTPESSSRRKRKKTMLRNFYYYREEWEKISERNKG